MTQETKQQMLYGEIPVSIFWQFWQQNAMTNGDQDPGHPGPPILYEDKLGCAKDFPLHTWRAGGFDYQGTEEAHQEMTDASLRDATIDIEAREKGEQSELESRKKRSRKPKQKHQHQHRNKRKNVWT